MIARRVEYRDFRNVEQAVFEPDERVSILHGENAQGKTNLLEGLYFLSQGRSFRCRRDADMVRHGARIGQISLLFDGNGRSGQKALVRFRGGSKPGRYCEWNGVRLEKHSEMVGRFRSVLFTPSHLELVSGSPEVRRHFLDMALCQLSYEYLSCMQRYYRVLEQRNAYLHQLREKSGLTGRYDDTLAVLTEALAREGEPISRIRAEYTAELDLIVGDVFSDMVGEGETPSVRYRDEEVGEDLVKGLSTRLREELIRGTTVMGPHRADLLLTINGRAMRGIASQGQTRTMALALKMGEGELSHRRSGEYPVYLFDDVFSELDGRRRSYLLSGVIPGQVIITSCDPIEGGHRVFAVKAGTVTAQG